jgi:hypothetical protein
MDRGKRFLLATSIAVSPLAFALACGARTPLLAPELFDATPETGMDARRDARRDALVDVNLPPIDAMPRDANRTDCPDADSTLVYLVSEENDLVSFYPPGGTFNTIGKLACPAPMGATPYSMGVDRKGVAYVAFTDQGFGKFAGLFRVSTLTAACLATPVQSSDVVFPPDGKWGMGYSTRGAGPAEDLFIIGIGGELGMIDFNANKAVKIADTQPTVSEGELTGTGDGRLFAFYVDDNSVTRIGELDKMTAKVVASDVLPGIDMGQAWAFAFWGGDFYTFTAPMGDNTHVDKYDPGTRKVTPVTTFNGHIVGAGVSTCAPSQ